MSTLRVDNFAPSAGGTAFGIEGVARLGAFIQGGAAGVLEDFNVSSLTDISVGRYELAATNTFSTADRPASVTTIGTSAFNNGVGFTFTTTSQRAYVFFNGTSSQAYTDDDAALLAYGDLA